MQRLFTDQFRINREPERATEGSEKMNLQQENKTNSREKRIFYSAIFRATLMAAALVATIWTIAKLNSGSVFSGNSTATLLGINADRGH